MSNRCDAKSLYNAVMADPDEIDKLEAENKVLKERLCNEKCMNCAKLFDIDFSGCICPDCFLSRT